MVLVTTPGASDADAYITLAEALARAQADLGRFATNWETGAGVDDAKREAAIQRATRDVDEHLGYTDRSDPWTPQALAFPRVGDYDLDGTLIIPDAIQRATYYQAIYVLANADLIDDSATRRSRGLANFSEQNVSGQLMDERAGILAPRAMEALEAFAQGTGGAFMAPISKA